MRFKDARDPVSSYPGSCLWLHDVPEFRSWHDRVNGGRGRVLWIKGRPGSGKSVLLRSLRTRIERQWAPLGSALLSGARPRARP